MSKFIELEVNGTTMIVNTDQIECLEPKNIKGNVVCTIYFKSKNSIIGYSSGTTSETYDDIKSKLV